MEVESFQAPLPGRCSPSGAGEPADPRPGAAPVLGGQQPRSRSRTPCAPLAGIARPGSGVARGRLGDRCSPKAESPVKALTLLVLEGRTRRFLLTLTHLRTFTTFSQWKAQGWGCGPFPCARPPAEPLVWAPAAAVLSPYPELSARAAPSRALRKPLNSVYPQRFFPPRATPQRLHGEGKGLPTCTFLFCKQKSRCGYPGCSGPPAQYRGSREASQLWLQPSRPPEAASLLAGFAAAPILLCVPMLRCRVPTSHPVLLPPLVPSSPTTALPSPPVPHHAPQSLLMVSLHSDTSISLPPPFILSSPQPPVTHIAPPVPTLA